ncbi:hypothetical protein K458DRAFT_331478 [Lentithecium fluviatile CBS 122367]|uniref:DUF7580 domain-containing protein n=1 Tax=Lentithecium fluviatile CBS 122367 TaxID=1168545 RepID=A0A6G1JFE5_9PLEO|nr:hypothetical protein K458DRAFT_331478 [Lentithecium fluviatile CBS 122367]
MVTGVETAGLVLGSIPLILASLEFYAKGIAVTRRCLKYEQQFNSLIVELQAENAIYTNTLNLLLAGIVKPKDMADFLANPRGKSWKEAEFDQKLNQRLGAAYWPYMATIGELNHSTERFRQKLKLDASWKPQFSDEQTFRKYYKRLEFSLKKSDYDDIVGTIRRANSSLHLMTTQAISLEAMQSSSTAGSQSIPNFSIINDRAQGLHSALRKGWQCACHSDHGVDLQLESRIHDGQSDDSDDEDSMQKPFHVIFCYSYNGQRTQQSVPAEDIPWSWEEADVQMTIREESGAGSAQSGKGVRFASRAQKAVKAALKPTPNLRPINNLCAAISTLEKLERDVCLSLLANEYAKQKYGILIYPSKVPPTDTEAWSTLSLRSVLYDPAFSRHSRLQLAVTLASSVLQLHETPWLSNNWGKDDILFIKRAGKIAYDHPFVSQCFNRTGLTQTSPCTSISAMNRIIRNQTLYALGIALIELWYGKPLSALRKAEDQAEADAMTEWNTAHRLVEELYNEAGEKYSDAVRRCIRCDFDRRASSLEDAAFQRAVYHGVVAQLKENLDFLF